MEWICTSLNCIQLNENSTFEMDLVSKNHNNVKLYMDVKTTKTVF